MANTVQQPRSHVPIAAQGQQPPRCSLAGQQAVLWSWQTSFAVLRALTCVVDSPVPVPALASVPYGVASQLPALASWQDA